MIMSEETQSDRIERKLDRVLEQSARHGADIAWLKRIVFGGGAVLVVSVSHLLRKIGL